MNDTASLVTRKLFWVSLAGALFVVYPNILWVPWNWVRLDPGDEMGFCAFFGFRFFYFWGLMHLQLRHSLARRFDTLRRRFLLHALYTLAGAGFFVGISWLLPLIDIWAGYTGNILIFQFVVSGLICTFVGHVTALYSAQREREREMAQLRLEHLQSQCKALAHQIQPHFFFNALNGLAALTCKGETSRTLDYISNLSGMFRYILQSQEKGMVPLREELDFLESFRHVMEVRFANKLHFVENIPDWAKDLRLPALSLLPLLENVIVHNCIDKEHLMRVQLSLTPQHELLMENPVYPKLTPADSHGTGLRYLQSRLRLLCCGKLHAEETDGIFRVTITLARP